MSPERFSESSGGEEERAGALFRQGGKVPPLDAAALQRVERRLSAATAQRRPSWLKTALGIGAVVGGSLALAASQGLFTPARPPAAARLLPPQQAPAPEVDAALSWGAEETPAPQAAPRPQEQVARRPGRGAAEPGHKQQPSPAPGAQPAPTGSLGLEAAALGEALAALRDHQPQGALTKLERYDREFPRGQLRAEAHRARLDALVALERWDEALGTLRRARKDDPEVGAGHSLGVLEGELLAKQSRCAEALGAFDAVLAAGAGAGLEERAWFGRISCRFSLGDGLGGRQDAESYLERFPDGRFSQRVRALKGR